MTTDRVIRWQRHDGPWAHDLYALATLCGTTALVMAWAFPLWGPAWGALCPLRELTGIPCPTCFGTRAVLAAVHGDVLRALRFNPLIAVGTMGMFVFVPGAAATVVGGWRRPMVSPRIVPALVWVGVALVALNWVYLLVAHT